MIEDEPILKIDKTIDNQCVFIQPNPKRWDEGISYLKKIIQWINHGEYDTLECKTVFNHWDLNTIRVCKRKDNISFYKSMVDCIEEHEHRNLRPYEHR